MNSILKYIKILINQLYKIWILEIKYPKKYPDTHIKSILSPEILSNTKGLFVEVDVQIKNPKIKIGKHTYIGNHTFIDSCERIGAFCSISSDVKIGLRNHPLYYISTSPVFYSKYRRWLSESTFDERNKKTVIIEDDVLISANVIIINGVKIGRGAVIGAGTVVNKDVPPYAIVAGVPARIIKYRFSTDLIKEVESSRWWEQDDSILKKHIHLSNFPEQFVKAVNNDK